MRFSGFSAGLLLTAAHWADAAAPPAQVPADTAYRNGFVYTVDAQDSVQQAVAIRAGRIVYVGSDAGLAAFVGEHTSVIDLRGRMLMPGLVDGHMHPLLGGAALLKCSLNYEQLTIEQMQTRIQGCLDQTQAREPDAWLEVVNWFQEGMLPAGATATRAVLDGLKTKRPIFVMSSFGHTVLVNSRALALAGITAATPDPLGGRIGRDAAGNASGILEDSAQNLVSKLLPKPTPVEDVNSAQAALEAMRKQGVTTFLDAMAEQPSLAAFTAVQRSGRLTARAHFAVLITPPEGREPKKAAARAAALARRYDQGPPGPPPTLDGAQRQVISRRSDLGAGAHGRDARALFRGPGKRGRPALGAGQEPRTGGVLPGGRPARRSHRRVCRGLGAAHARGRRSGGARGARWDAGAAGAFPGQGHPRRHRTR